MSDILNEPRWPHDSEKWPVQWNRTGGLIEMCDDHLAPQTGNLICELGVAKGVSTEIFSRYGEVHGVDLTIWAEATARFKDRSGVTLIRMDSLAAAEVVPDGYYTLVYLDTRHDFEWVRDEIRAWRSKIRPGGFISGHDHNCEWPGVQEAVALELGGPMHVYRDSSWIVQL